MKIFGIGTGLAAMTKASKVESGHSVPTQGNFSDFKNIPDWSSTRHLRGKGIHTDPQGLHFRIVNDYIETPNPSPGGAHIELTFNNSLMIGLVGDTGAADGHQVLNALYAQETDFNIILGDGLYEVGPKNPDDPLLYQRLGKYAKLKKTFYVPGNHDYYAKHQPIPNHLAYPKSILPSGYYDISCFFKQGDQKIETVRILMIDMNVLHSDPKQREWIQKTLKTSSAKYIFFCDHQPLHTLGPKHTTPPPSAYWLEKLAIKYRVQAIFSGHNHYASLRLAENSPWEFILGGGSPSKLEYPPGTNKNDENIKVEDEDTLTFAFAKPSFATAKIDSTGLSIKILHAGKKSSVTGLLEISQGMQNSDPKLKIEGEISRNRSKTPFYLSYQFAILFTSSVAALAMAKIRSSDQNRIHRKEEQKLLKEFDSRADYRSIPKSIRV